MSARATRNFAGLALGGLALIGVTFKIKDFVINRKAFSPVADGLLFVGTVVVPATGAYLLLSKSSPSTGVVLGGSALIGLPVAAYGVSTALADAEFL